VALVAEPHRRSHDGRRSISEPVSSAWPAGDQDLFDYDFTPNSPFILMAKDLGYAIQEESDRGLPLQTASSAVALFMKIFPP
jgi:hypothetical protein